ncbi:MAG: peptidoglycan-binding protein [Ilumatobacteraceae bacterium]
MPALHGIDVSHNNLFNGGPIDWNAVATTSPALTFVMARMSHGGRGDDNLRIDRQAINNRDGMRAAFPNTARGYYHFLGTSTPQVQAQHFRSVVGDDANRDGAFGDATTERVRRLQVDCGLPATGVVDAITWSALAAPDLVPA